MLHVPWNCLIWDSCISKTLECFRHIHYNKQYRNKYMRNETGVRTMLTEKENYLRVLHGEIPEWIPSYTFGKMPGSDINNCWGNISK